MIDYSNKISWKHKNGIKPIMRMEIIILQNFLNSNEKENFERLTWFKTIIAFSKWWHHNWIKLVGEQHKRLSTPQLLEK